ncbi:MAG: caspase family protein [Calditrichaceae bacterium]|nr:caspase family protein [Calditrichaceae bacterium]
MNIKINQMLTSMLLSLQIILFTSCDFKGDSAAKEETIAPTEIFIQGVGMDAQRAAFNSSGTHLITSGQNGTTIWDLQAKKELISLYKNEAHSSAISKSGRYLITFSPADYGIIKICNLTNLKINSLRIFEEKEVGYGRYISGITISDDEKYFALYSENIKIFDLESLKQINEIELKERHYLFNYRKQGLTFLPGTSNLLSISYDISFSEPDVLTEEGDLNLNQENQFSINIWDIHTKEQKNDISFNSKFIYSWTISHDYRKLALLLINKELRVVDLINHTISNYNIEIADDIDVINFRKDGNLLFTNREGIVGMYNLNTGESEFYLTDLGSHFRAHSCIDRAISNDGENIAFCSGYSTLLLYNVPDNEITVLTDEAQGLFGAYYDSDSLINILTSNQIITQNGPNFRTKGSKVKRLLDYVNADQLLVENINTVERHIFDLTLPGTIFSGDINENEYYSAFTRDGRYAFKSVQQGESDYFLALIDLNNMYASPVRLERSGGYGINIKVFDNNRKAIIAGFASDSLAIWDLQTGKQINQLDIQSGNALAFDFIDENKCMIGVRGIIRLYNMKTLEVIKTYTPEGYDGRYKDIRKIIFSPDKKYFATGDTDGLVTIWDFNKDKEIISFNTHKNGITSLAFSPDGKNIVSGSYNGKSLVISEVTTGKEIARFILFSDGEWIVISPEGYFNASPNGAKYLNIRVGDQVYSIDNFHEKYFNPAYIASVLGGKTVKAVADIRKGIAPPPVVEIISPQANSEFESENITVTVSAKDMGGEIDEIRLYHNGKAVGEETRGMKPAAQRKELSAPVSNNKAAKSSSAVSDAGFTKSYSISLVDGDNIFRAIGFSKDRTESNPAEIVVRLVGGSRSVTMHVFTVGINNYKNPALNLNYAQPDARGIVDFFRKKGKGLFRNVDIRDLYNEQATKDNILSQLKQLENTNPQDAVLIYLAGHGENINDKWYFIPYELTYPEREEDVLSKALSSDELSSSIKDIKAQKILILIDACKSGAALLAFRGFEDRKALTQLSRATGIHVVAASTKDQFASEVQELGHGVFTYTLLQGLNGRAAGSGESITVRKLLGYIEEQLPELTKKYRQEAQYPVVDSKGMDFPLVIRR